MHENTEDVIIISETCIAFLVLKSACLKKYTMPVSVGVIGTVNGRSASSSPTGNSAVNTSSFPAKGIKEKTKANRTQKSSQDVCQLQQTTAQKTKEKVTALLALHKTQHLIQLSFPLLIKTFIIIQKCIKRPLETSSMSGSQSGSLSDSSSDGEESSSSDPDDMEDDEEDNDEDESIDSGDSDSEKESTVKRKGKVIMTLTLVLLCYVTLQYVKAVAQIV